MRPPSTKNTGIIALIVLTTILFPGAMSSCSTSGDQKKPIDLCGHWDKTENFLLSEMASSIAYIPLETKEECFIPNAYECSIRITDKHIFIVQRSKPMMIFDRTGKFLGKVGSIGEGPGEVLAISSYVVNEEDQWIAVFKPSDSSILMFTMNGGLIRDFPVDKSIVRLISDPKGNIVGLSIDIKNNTIGDSRLVYLSPAGQEIRRVEMFKSPDLKNRLLMSDALSIRWENDGLIRIHEAPFDKIYQRNKRGNWEIFPGFTPGEMAEIQQVRETKDYYFILATNPSLHYFIALKATGAVTGCSFLIEAFGPDICGIFNDLDGGLPFWPKSQILKNEMVSMFDATALIDCAKGTLDTYGGTAPKVKETFKKMAAGLTYEDNPVVAIVTLK